MKKNYKVENSQELVFLGLAGILIVFFSIMQLVYSQDGTCGIQTCGGNSAFQPIKINQKVNGICINLEISCCDGEISVGTTAVTDDSTISTEEETSPDPTTTEEITPEPTTTTEEETSTTPEPTTTTEETSSPEIVTPTAGQEVADGCTSCDNEKYGTLVHHRDCTKFCICQWYDDQGRNVVKDCPSGLYFDKGSQRCEWPILSDCPFKDVQ